MSHGAWKSRTLAYPLIVRFAFDFDVERHGYSFWSRNIARMPARRSNGPRISYGDSAERTTLHSFECRRLLWRGPRAYSHFTYRKGSCCPARLGSSEAQLKRVRFSGRLGQRLTVVRVVRVLRAQRKLDAEPADALLGGDRRVGLR